MKLLVEGQKISSFDSPPVRLVAGSTEFVPIELQCSSDWDGLLMTVQFIQKGKTINKYIGEARTLNVPADISAGWLMISCFGAKADTAVFGTVNGYEIEVSPAGLSSTEQEPIPPTPNLYNQLISEIKRYAEETEASADKVKEAQETSAQAKTIAEQIQKNAQDGVYNGRDGEQGPQGIQGPTGPQGPQGLKGEPGTTDFNELQSIPFTPILSDTLEVTTLNEGAYVVNIESVNVLVNGESPLSSGESFTLPKGTFIFKSADSQMGLVGNFGGMYIPDSSDINWWREMGGPSFTTFRDLEQKQDTLVSGQNIKTINNESILGNGNFELPKSPITVVNESKYTFKEDGLYYFTKECKYKMGDYTYIIPSCSIIIYAKREDCDTYLTIAPPRKFNDDPAIPTTFDYNISDRKGNIKSVSLLSFAEGINLYLTAITDAVTAETNKIVTTGNVDEETGLTALNTSGIGKGLKLENEELSVNTEGLDISKATVEDATYEMPATPLMSGILFPLMQEMSTNQQRFLGLNWKSDFNNLHEDTEHYTIADARNNQEIYIWLKRNDGINTGAQGVLTLELFGNTVTLGNLETNTTNILIHIIQPNQQYVMIDFFDTSSDVVVSDSYSLNANKSKGTFPMIIKDSPSITLRTSVGNFAAGTSVNIFKKSWIINQ